MGETARKSFVATTVAVAVVAAALALWHLKVLIALLLVAFIISAAMRPGVELLQRHRVPRALGVTLHYMGLLIVIGLLLWLIVPRAITQVQHATGSLPASKGSPLHKAVTHSHGIKHDILVGIERRLNSLPHGDKLVMRPSTPARSRSRSSSASSSRRRSSVRCASCGWTRGRCSIAAAG